MWHSLSVQASFANVTWTCIFPLFIVVVCNLWHNVVSFIRLYMALSQAWCLPYMNMLIPIVLVVVQMIQTNYGDIVLKFIAVPSFNRWCLFISHLKMYLPLFFDVVGGQLHCLPTNHDNIVVTTLQHYCQYHYYKFSPYTTCGVLVFPMPRYIHI